MIVLAVVFVVWTRRRRLNSKSAIILCTPPLSLSVLHCFFLFFTAGRNFTTKATRGSNNTERPPLLVEEKSETLQVMSEKKTKLDEQLKKVQEEHKDVMVLLHLLTSHKTVVSKHMHDLLSEKESIQTQKQDGKGLKKDSLETKARLNRKIQDVDTILKAVHYGETMVGEKKTELDNIIEEINKQTRGDK